MTALFDVITKFGGDHDFVAERRERFANKPFIGQWPVNLGGIEERNAFFIGCTNDLNALVYGAGGP